MNSGVLVASPPCCCFRESTKRPRTESSEPQAWRDSLITPYRRTRGENATRAHPFFAPERLSSTSDRMSDVPTAAGGTTSEAEPAEGAK